MERMHEKLLPWEGRVVMIFYKHAAVLQADAMV